MKDAQDPLERAWLRDLSQIGTGPLTDAVIQGWVRPLFQEALRPGELYLATHSMGLPPDQAARDLAAYATEWARAGAFAWEPWLAWREWYRTALAGLLGAARADCVVPRESAGAALGTVLGTLPPGARVVCGEGEFDSLATVLGQWARLGRIRLRVVRAGELAAAVREGAELAVVSQVGFATGEVADTGALAAECHAHGAALLVDVYHSLGVLEVDVAGWDYCVGGCYKYLRGGPGAAFLYVSPERLPWMGALDTGWFALEPGWDAAPGEQPRLAGGGDALLGGTPAVAAWYGARAGLELVGALGVRRLRERGLTAKRVLAEALAARGVRAVATGEEHGAFVSVDVGARAGVAAALQLRGVVANVRRGQLRLTPDLLCLEDELLRAARVMAEVLQATG